MAKVVFFPSKLWTRTWSASGPAVLIGLGVLLGSQLCLALGNPTDLQAVEPSPDDVSAAARYFDEGRSAFKQERFVEAAEAFEKADALAPNAKVLLLAIQSRELGGHASRAATLAALATQRHPKDELFADVGQLLKTARSEFNFVTVLCDDPCQVMVGNRLLHGAAATRRFLFLEQGKYRIRATWSNGKSLSKYYEADVGKKGRLEFDSSNEGTSASSPDGASDEPEPSNPSAEEAPEPARSQPDEAAPKSRKSSSASGEPDEDYWADGETTEEDPPDDPLAASAQAKEAAELESEDTEAQSSGWSPLVFWVGAGATVALAGVSTWSGVHTLNNPGREAVVRDCVGLGEMCPTYQEGLRNQDRTNILWTVTASVGVISGLIGWLFTDWDHGIFGGDPQAAAKNQPHVNWQLQPLVGVTRGAHAVNPNGFALTGSYLTATGSF